MQYLFATIQDPESDFYGRVGAALEARGHDVHHATVSRRAARLLGERGRSAGCLLDEMASLPAPTADEVDRIERRYGLSSLREVYGIDRASADLPDDRAVARTVAYFRAVERLFDELEPDVVVPEVGCETVRIATHLVALDRGIPVLFLFYTIFPSPLRLYVDRMDSPIVAREELRALTGAEREELDAFRSTFIARGAPIRAYRSVPLHPRRLVSWARFGLQKLGEDRDNDYLRPLVMAKQDAQELVRARAARLVYRQRDPARRFVYFPLHVSDDYKIRRLIPHLADQPAIVAQIADALPPGYDLVLKEHPLSIGRNPLGYLRRLTARRNVRLVHPRESSHDLMRAADAVAVISSTVGLEALLYRKPVLTLGSPFYAGYGVTLDLASPAEIQERIPELLRFRPDPERTDRFLHAAMRSCRPGAPVLVDSTDENAAALAATLDEAARELAVAGEGRWRQTRLSRAT